MKIEMIARWHSYMPGQVVEVSEAVGKLLTARNLAKAISAPPKDKMVRSSQTKGIASARR